MDTLSIQKAEWDSDFFGYGVGTLEIMPGATIDHSLLTNLDKFYNLVYIFVRDVSARTNDDLDKIDKNLKMAGAFLIDKRTYEKMPVQKKVDRLPFNITEADGYNVDEIIQLGVQAGEYSRFKMDQGFKNGELNKLYTAWMKDSLNGKAANKVYVSHENGKPTGVLTLSLKNDHVVMNLMAVDKAKRNKGIGSSFVEAAKYYAGINNKNIISLVAQSGNKEAMNMYKKFGFETYRVDYIYHLWTNSKP